MVNEEIVTALRNAVEHGESLQEAMQIMMNSGYSPQEVQEASKYIGGGTLYMQQPKPEEHLVMPEQKSRISSIAFWKKEQKPQISQPIQQPVQQQQVRPQMQQIQPQLQTVEQFPVQQTSQPQLKSSSVPLAKQLEKIGPRKPSHLKEIVLVIILLILIGVLAATIFFKNTILAWFA